MDTTMTLSPVFLCLTLLSPVLSFSLSELFNKPWWQRPENYDPRFNPYLYQGDILLPFNHRHKGLGARHATDSKNLWPDATVYYEFADDHPKDAKIFVFESMRTIENVSCVKFVEKESLKMLKITNHQSLGCHSGIGVNMYTSENDFFSNKKYTLLNLKFPRCNKTETITHELLHTLGFYHEQQRLDRDDYIKVIYDNIQPNGISNFDKTGPFNNPTEKMPYDVHSLMHYWSTSWSKNGKPTILDKKNKEDPTIYEPLKMSDLDIQKLNKLYKCGETKAEEAAKPKAEPAKPKNEPAKPKAKPKPKSKPKAKPKPKSRGKAKPKGKPTVPNNYNRATQKILA